MLTTILVLSVINTALIVLILCRTGLTILTLNNLADALLSALNFQNRQIKKVGEVVESAMDCLLVADYKATTISGRDVAN